jgi:peptide/nickel transport system permease protein
VEGVNQLIRFLVRRVSQAIPTALAVLIFVFFLFSVLPGSIVGGDDGRVVDASVAERIRKEFNLDRPIHERFVIYIKGIVTGDLGISYRTREPVTSMLAARLWPSFKLALAGMAVAIVIGVPHGFLAALKPGGALDMSTMAVAVSGQSIPQFWFGILLMYGFSLQFRILPSFGYGDGGVIYLILPALTLGLGYMALLARTTRAAVIEIMGADFIRTARSKGMSEGKVVRWHILRNTLVLIVTTVGLQFGTMMGQAVVVEKLFSWPGLGSLLVDSVFQRDIPTVQGCILVIVLFFLAVNTLTDILYSIIDPRIRYS